MKLYKTKENQVSLAEDDQDNEFKYLAEQIESQNAENINTAIMNCNSLCIHSRRLLLKRFYCTSFVLKRYTRPAATWRII